VTVTAGESIVATAVSTDGAATNDISLTATKGSVTVDDVNAGLAGNVTISAGTSIDEAGAGDPGADIAGAVVSLTANNGGIGVGNAIEFNAATKVNADSSAAGGDIALVSTAATPIGLINAGSGNVTLDSAGDITDADADVAVDIIANNVTITLSAAGDVGKAADALETDIDRLTVNDTNATGLYVTEANGLELVNVNITVL